MSRRQQRRGSSSRNVRAALIGAALLLFIAGLYFGVQLGKPPPPPDFSVLNGEAPQGTVDGASSVDGAPLGNVPAPRDTPPATSQGAGQPPPKATASTRSSVKPPSAPPSVPEADGVRIALVIDDLGRSLNDLEVLGRLGIPITYAVLPFESQTAAVVAELRRRGEEVLCHLPMEAKGGNNPGPGALLANMDRAELQAATERALAAVPGAVGVNNHMGSSITSNPRAIEAVMSVVADSNLYFLDSRTSVDTLAYATARRLGLPAGERQVFLDTTLDPAAIQEQFDRLLQIARQRGSAIAIAHPHAMTLDVLGQRVPEAKAAGIRFVPASALLDR